MNILQRNSSRNYLLDDDVKKESSYNNRGNASSPHNRNFTGNYQKSKKLHEGSNENIHEQNEIVRLPSIININAIKPPQYIAYTSKDIDGDVILNDITGELWVQPSNSLLSKKSENRLKSKVENARKQYQLMNESRKSKSELNNSGDVKTSSEIKDGNNLKTNFDNNFKRNFDKYLSDVQKLIGIINNII